MTQIKPRPRPPQMRIIRSAGAVIWRIRPSKQEAYPDQQIFPENPGDIEVLLVHRPRFNDWSWPKGKHESGESLPATAIREVEEETGLTVRLGAPLATQRYRLGTGITKEVHYWVGSLDLGGGATRMRPPVKPAPMAEIDRIQWVAPRHAFRLLNRRGDRRLLDELLLRLEAGRLVTRTLIFTRHGDSDKLADASAEIDRSLPLNRRGIQQSLQLPTLYSAFGVEQLYSSPARRCLTTISPYASLSGLAVKRDPVLLGGDFQQTEAFRSWLKTLLGENDRSPAAVCLHRSLLPALVGELALHSPSPLVIKLPQDPDYLATGTSLIVHLAIGNEEQANPEIGQNRRDKEKTTSLPAMTVKADYRTGNRRRHAAVTLDPKDLPTPATLPRATQPSGPENENASATGDLSQSTKTAKAVSPASIAQTMALMARAARGKPEPNVNPSIPAATDRLPETSNSTPTGPVNVARPAVVSQSRLEVASKDSMVDPSFTAPPLAEITDDDWDSDDNLEMSEVVVSNDDSLRVCDFEVYQLR